MDVIELEDHLPREHVFTLKVSHSPHGLHYEIEYEFEEDSNATVVILEKIIERIKCG